MMRSSNVGILIAALLKPKCALRARIQASFMD
jgi:hypothetical protein